MVGVWPDERINFGLDTRMDTLICGAALAYFVRSLPHGQLPEALSKMVGWFLAPLAFVGMIAVIHTVTWYSPWMGWLGYVLVAGASVIVIADLVVGRHSLLARPLTVPPMIFIGKISYGLYLLHLPVYYIVEDLIPTAALPIRLAIKVLVSLVLAWASFNWIEKRSLKLKAKFESPVRGSAS